MRALEAAGESWIGRFIAPILASNRRLLHRLID
jgi:hypothetical protein